MKCHFCDKEATVHLTEIMNGQIMEIHLCEEHAKEKGGFFNQPFSAADFFSAFSDVLNEPTFIREGAQMVCPECQMTYADFAKSGRLGCAKCYDSFKEALLPLIKRVQRATGHQGKRPFPVSEKGKKQLKIQGLQRELELCINAEDFERAAKLRDEIKKLEKKKSAAQDES